MRERKIAAVSDNIDKQHTYQELMKQHTKAINFEFYFEAILIDYATIEDRLLSLIYHMGFISNRCSNKIWKKERECLKEIVTKYKRSDENDTLGLTKVSGKIKIIRCVFLWAVDSEEYQDNKHLKALKKQCENIDCEQVVRRLEELEEWIKYRDEIIHALLNKKLESIDSKKREIAIKGLEIARYLDSQNKLIKKNNSIRKSINAPCNW